ncbi:MAG: DUF262 domain-containing protein [Bifidobacterium sp.]|nr:DUF262 domain-containing protein [Bifidobacterium sp.]
MSIDASEKPLSKVFTSDYRFVIPTFQRAYQWRRQQMTQLITDIIDACSARGPYFLGSLILVREDGGVHQVIDGQQRLVSLSIMFAVLRELEDDPQLRAGLDGLLGEAGDKLRGIASEPRLALRDRDEEFFREYVQAGDLEALFDLREQDCATQAQRNIMDNARCAYNELAKMSDEERRLFATYLVNDVMFVIVTTDDLSGAYRIFDVMNMRGMPLTASDVFKAKVVSHISPGARDAYARYWDDIMEPFGDDTVRIEAFFRDLHLILTGKPMCEQLLADFDADVLVDYFDKGNAIDFIDDVLRPYVTAWRILERPADSALRGAAVDTLVGLNDYPTHDWRPVAMWAVVNSISNLDDPDTQVFEEQSTGRGVPAKLHDLTRLADVLRALDRVTGIDALNGEGTVERRTRACVAIRELRKGTALQRIRGFVVTGDQQRAAMLHLRGELGVDDAMRRLLLVRANEQMAGRRITRPRSLNAIRLVPEHVPARSEFAKWPAEQCDYWVDRIGNFVLTQASEKSVRDLHDFDDRRGRLLQSVASRRFPLTDELAGRPTLTPDALAARQEETVKLIAQAWNIRYDERHQDLAKMEMANLGGGAEHRARPNAKRLTVAEAVRAGLLALGETLVWDRPRKHEHWEVTVTADGLRLPDGREFNSPTAAAKDVSGGSTAKLDVWKRASTGQSLAEVWKGYRKRH